jgi:hypothetical protein
MAIGGFPSFVEEVKVDFSPTRLNIFMSISVQTEKKRGILKLLGGIK